MIISSEKFVPHTLEHLIVAKVFPTPLPEEFYKKICREYEQVSDATSNRIAYESDGLKVTGISCMPVRTEIGKHPIYIYNRGGNREYGKLTVLSIMRSLLPFASKGYITYASNYRGNDGGEGIDEFGGCDVDDILNLIEIAKQDPAWDGKNIFMLGHSRGGMMTYMTLREISGINAAVSLAGIATVMEHDNPELSHEKNLFQRILQVAEKNDPAEFVKRSALQWADEIDTPLLLQHGTSDEAVTVDHSVMLDKKLSEFGKRHELIIHEGGNHALLRQWSDVIEKSLLWFERFRT